MIQKAMRPPDDDALRPLFGRYEEGEIFWVPLRDYFVGCEARIHYLQAGSTLPIVARILSLLEEGREFSFHQISEKLETKGRYGARVLGEVLAALVRAKLLQSSVEGWFSSLSPGTQDPSRVTAAVVNDSCYYLPRASHFYPQLPRFASIAHDSDGKWWQQPDEESVYDKSWLARKMAEGMTKFWENKESADFPVLSETAEILCRSGLLSRKGILLSAAVQPHAVFKTDHVAWHRCCFSLDPNSDRKPGQIFVIQRTLPHRNEEYTHYMNARCRQDLSFFASLRDFAFRFRVDEESQYNDGNFFEF